MKVCLIAEGCYPFVVGGVSSWVNNLIRMFPQIEFSIVAIAADRSLRGKYAYTLPQNVTEVYELYLNDVDWGKKRPLRMKSEEYHALRSLILNKSPEWNKMFDFFSQESVSLNALLMGEDFFHAVSELYSTSYPQLFFSDFLWSVRSMYLPLFLTMKMTLPKADLYHCVSTGYAGILGCMAKHRYGGRLLISEHGIYTREREEELIKAKWVKEQYKGLWIEHFRKMSQFAYKEADVVTSLYEQARGLQEELGCPPEKLLVTPNGVSVESLQHLKGKTEDDEGYVNLGAVLRVTPIKDVKTMIQAFAFAKSQEPRLRLWIMGPAEEDREYAQECLDMVQTLRLQDVIFTGSIDIHDYLGRMDATILTSISEGQPLTILEGFAAHKPAIATDVGNCAGLIYGERDDFGAAGIVTHIMNIEEIAEAMVQIAQKPELRKHMGEVGFRRVCAFYRKEDMQRSYKKIYRDFANRAGLIWKEDEDSVE